ncbi:helix-turn-helix transcriptional regulator [Frankia sp. AgB1.9]|uniref:winged helix-turn-helix transcriptional regulator n=1 Tax=unclassified Frankia TaxID=2632575 RepID=UPI00193479EB|nr:MULTISPECIES: helix-turn-helix domain-containing protein [unclassified Frankia]MBL7494016.1 helix-turn-helix transcriptional regulator [Frankia sp. AgW1.1]MBL7549250.1 helix-turn-helix transcriptional regulator [Frankia sp. AgB1.9]MBL7619467.1 helix-turn-helix transcriptional regulator [Frankia sp. AgB1.8]
MPTTPRSGYAHFCMLAKALERLGDRWALLVVRDLLTGPKRFTDLMDRLGGITPRTLTQRLRDLESDGLVLVDREPGRREVWYSLTPVGLDLAPALEELSLWGLRHLAAPPAPGEPAHPEHLLNGVRLFLDRWALDVGPVSWVFRTLDHDDVYTITGRDGRWTLTSGAGPNPDVELIGDRRDLAAYFATLHPARTVGHPGVRVQGSDREIGRFLDAIAAFPRLPPVAAP